MQDGTNGLTRRQALGASAMAAAAAGSAAQAAPTPVPAPVSAEAASLLYPFPSATRTVRDLSGLWRFRLDPRDEGRGAGWPQAGLGPQARTIPLPCSWNDLFDDAANYFGPAWYETELFDDGAPGRRILRFGSVIYHAEVWLNGRRLGEHLGGYLPFAFDVTGLLKPGAPNRLVVRVENELRLDRVPAIPDPKTAGAIQSDYPQTTYDFFPYAGINRPVWLVATPDTHVSDVGVTTRFEGAAGVVAVEVEVSGGWSGPGRLTLEGGAQTVSAPVELRGGRGRAELRVPAVRAWNPDDPYLHRLTVALGPAERPIDAYHLDIGVRTVEVKGSQILVNGKPVFLKGFGKHEDFAIHGKGLDLPVLVRDYELLKWIGANSFRTSHYPYAEEALQLADRYGFLVIAETPGVSLVFMDPPEIQQARYRQLEADLEALIARDRNHPCVILWSLANEPILKPFHSSIEAPPDAVETGRKFFAGLFAKARALDGTRPVALVSVQGGPAEWVGQGDVICQNSYNGWYVISGRIEDARAALEKEVAALRARHGDKPIIYTEFGADAVAGSHAEPAVMWTEEYQAELIAMYYETLRKHPYVVGTHPWAFADFRTPQSIMRVTSLNQKGVFTRDRRPKLAATRLRALWKA